MLIGWRERIVREQEEGRVEKEVTEYFQMDVVQNP